MTFCQAGIIKLHSQRKANALNQRKELSQAKMWAGSQEATREERVAQTNVKSNLLTFIVMLGS